MALTDKLDFAYNGEEEERIKWSLEETGNYSTKSAILRLVEV